MKSVILTAAVTFAAWISAVSGAMVKSKLHDLETLAAGGGCSRDSRPDMLPVRNEPDDDDRPLLGGGKGKMQHLSASAEQQLSLFACNHKSMTDSSAHYALRDDLIAHLWALKEECEEDDSDV
ncbi:hypothetical protein PCANC_20793 [Puccinia coronata f. sp. avenae]|uniref:Uncharacterized protein n=1 Tax=Puccinia coronata f. sp. avenae TaxID=200324 RepID=A0A2N5U872_9BASI|nr:hypothetical protein PCANC_20793 [Puccinia coronata f. sp. avenae]